MSTIPNNKRIAILGGGTNTYISNHLALSAPAYGTTAINLYNKFQHHVDNKMEVDLYLTDMCIKGRQGLFAREKPLDTPEDIEVLVDKLVADPDTRVIIFNVAMVDFKPELGTLQFKNQPSASFTEFGKYAQRLPSRVESLELILTPYDKIINKIRKERKDILLVGFKTTCGATKEEQFHKGLKLCKDASANIVFVNDVDKDRIESLNLVNQLLKTYEEETSTLPPNMQIFKQTAKFINILQEAESAEKEALTKLRDSYQNNGLVTPEESSYWYNTRDEALDALVQMVLDRSHLHFTRSTVVDSETIPWNIRQPTDRFERFPLIPNPIIPETFRVVFDWVRSQGAYKKGPTGSTVGHMGIKLGPNEFLTTKRKTDFNKMEEVGLVRVITDDPDNVFGYKHFFKSDNEVEVLKFIKSVLEYTDNEIIDLTYFSDMEGYSLLSNFIKDVDLKSFSRKELKELGYKLDFKVIAFGAKPSVGGQSQRSLFEAFPDLDCIVHFHCPLKPESRKLFNTTDQFSYECGSRECIQSCITGFKEYKVSETHSIWAGHMNYHGPNIVFNSNINPQLVIDFISSHWDLSKKTTGLSSELI